MVLSSSPSRCTPFQSGLGKYLHLRRAWEPAPPLTSYRLKISLQLPIPPGKEDFLMTRILDKLGVAFYCLLLEWLLAHCLGLAGVLLVVGLVKLLLDHAEQSSPSRQVVTVCPDRNTYPITGR